MKIILFVLLLIPAICSAQWTTEQKVLSGVFMTALVIDYGQTRGIVKEISEGRDRWEANPIIGKTPSYGRVNAYFIAVPIVSYLILDNIPSEQRTWALRAMTALEVSMIAHNYAIGIRTNF